MENKQSTINNFIKKSEEENIITVDEFIDVIKDAIEEIEKIDNISNNNSSYDIIYRIKNGYGYNISLSDDKKNYLRVDLSFGDMRNLMPKDKIAELRSKIEDANKKTRCAKGYLSDNQGKEKNELQFSVSYETYMYPHTSRPQLLQHIIISKKIIDMYMERTLDAIQV